MKVDWQPYKGRLIWCLNPQNFLSSWMLRSQEGSPKRKLREHTNLTLKHKMYKNQNEGKRRNNDKDTSCMTYFILVLSHSRMCI